MRDTVNATNYSVSALQDAERAKVETRRNWTVAEFWAGEFIASLVIPQKQQVLDQATSYEAWRHELEVNATKREYRFKTLLETHQRRLRDLHLELELEYKNHLRADAKELFSASEKTALEANTKLETVLKEEKECHENIAKAYAAIQRLLQEHKEATKAYNEQDPKDRERSFATMLEGSGADPGH